MLNRIFDKKIIFQNDLSKMLLKGNIKEIIIRFDEFIDPKYKEENLTSFHENQRKYYQDLYFDSLGNLREEVQYEYIDEIEFHKYSHYNIKNQLIYKILKFQDHLISFEYKISNKLNSICVTQKINNVKDKDYKKTLIIKNANLKKEITEDLIRGRTFKKYENGKLIEVNKYLHKRIFKYDNFGNIIRIEYCHNSGAIDYCYVSKNYEYDSENRLISCAIHSESENEKIIMNYKYENDLQGNWIKKTISNTKDKTITNVYRKIQYYNT